MKRDEVLRVLAASREELGSLGVRSLSIFGSVARDEAQPGSDVDMLVEFDRPTGLFGLIRLKHRLEELLGCSVDVGTPNGLRPSIRDDVLREAVRVA